MPLLCLSLALALASQDQSVPKSMEGRIDALIAGVVGKKSPGLVVIVQQGDRTLYRKASGSADLAGKVSLTTATPMRIASLSKAFTANLIQKLAADGKLKLDDLITPYLPTPPVLWGKITVRQLLNQVSGIPDYTNDATLVSGFGKPGGPKQILAWATTKPLGFAPGARFEYSNTNYILLGLIAEKVGGAPLEEQLQTRIFGPLGMTGAKLPRKGTTTPGEATGTTTGKAKAFVAAREIDMGWPYAAGAIVASGDDMALWLAGLAKGIALTPAQRAEAFTPAKLNDEELSFYGFGWILGTRGAAPMISHGGGINGFSSYVAYLPASDVRLVILSNSEEGDTFGLAKPVLDAIEGKETVVGISDKDPKLTARLRAVVDKMLLGQRDAAEFDAAFLKAVPDDLYAKTGKGLGELGEIDEFTLVKDATSAQGRVREYRLSLGDATLSVVFTLRTDGKISGFVLR